MAVVAIFANGKMYKGEEEIAEYYKEKNSSRSGNSANVSGDWGDMVSPIDGTVISGKRQHREHCKKHGVVCIGNDKIEKQKPNYSPEKRREAIEKAMKEHGY